MKARRWMVALAAAAAWAVATAGTASAGSGAALVGSWIDCGGTLEIQANGHWVYRPLFGGCPAQGTWVQHDGRLALVLGETKACTVRRGWMRADLSPQVAGDVLELSAPDLGTWVKRFSRGELDRQRWMLTTDENARTEMFLCFASTGAFIDGWYRAASPNCGFLSCTGRVLHVDREGGAWHVWTVCGGQCPCAATLSLAPTKTGALDGVYGASSCMDAHYGHLTGKRLPFTGKPRR